MPHALGPALDSAWRTHTPVTDFERIYYNWFCVTPTLLFEVISWEDVPQYVRDIVVNRGVRDPALDYDSVDEDFYRAMLDFLEPAVGR